MQNDREITQEMCAKGFTDEVFPLDVEITSDDPMAYMRLVGVVQDQFCGGRYGPSVYLENLHPHASITAVIEVNFDSQGPTSESHSVPGRSRKHVGCSYWRPDFGHVQHYVRRILSASYD
jgi:hypothetical protein